MARQHKKQQRKNALDEARTLNETPQAITKEFQQEDAEDGSDLLDELEPEPEDMGSCLGEPDADDSDYWFEFYGVESLDELMEKD